MPFLADLQVRRFDYLEFRCRLQHPEGRKEKCVRKWSSHNEGVYGKGRHTRMCAWYL